MRKLLLLLLLASPLLIIFINQPAEKAINYADESSFGKRVSNGARFLRGEINKIRKDDRILTIRAGGDDTVDIVISKDSQFYLKLKESVGGETKEYSGDYFPKLKSGDLVDLELLEGTVFSKKVLVYDLENFSL